MIERITLARAGALDGIRRGNACAVLSEEDFATLRGLAERYLSVRGGFTRFVESVGGWVQRGIERLPATWRDTLHHRARDALGMAYRGAILGMDADDRGKRGSGLMYRLLTTGSGAVTGTAGLAGVVADLPTSTLLVLRSIADIAREKGYDIRDPAVQATCIEAFAFGGPTDEDDDADLAFWSSRAAVPILAEMIPEVAARLTGRLAAMLPARAVPMVAVVASAGINWHFSGFFQAMGGILLELKPIEDRYGRAQVRACFEGVVRALRGG